MRIAVIGVGLIGELHARIFRRNPLCKLVAVCDAELSKAEKLAAELGCRAYEDFLELLADEELDAVSVATPETLRREPAIAAARHGLKLLLEKPLGRTIAEVDRLIEELEAEGAEPAVNFILHAEPRFASMKALVADGAVGSLVSISARRVGTRLGIEKYAPWTDLLSSTLIHDIEMALSVNNAPAERVYAEAVVRVCEKYGCHDAVAATVRMADGALALFETSWVLPPTQVEPLDPSFRLIGDRGSIVIEGSSQGMQVTSEEGFQRPDMTHWPMLPDGVGGALAHSLDTFVARVLADQPPLVGLHKARDAEAVVAAMKRSIETESPVNLTEIG